jgi:hypothetical protein
MTNKIVQHIPNFCDVDPKEAEFNTLEELLNISWVKSWKKDHDKKGPFFRYSLNEKYLMIERNEGKWWWTIGRIQRPDEVDLPEWKPIYE